MNSILFRVFSAKSENGRLSFLKTLQKNLLKPLALLRSSIRISSFRVIQAGNVLLRWIELISLQQSLTFKFASTNFLMKIWVSRAIDSRTFVVNI